MITNRTYYKGEIYIPEAKPSASNASSSAIEEVESFINEYEEDCLLKCLGPSLYNDLILNIDESQESLIDTNSDQKWDDLMNGKTYTDPENSSRFKTWKGLRFKSPLSNSEYNRSLLAYYVYYFYEQKQYITNTLTGHQIESSKNAVSVPPTNKVVFAWRKFVTLVQGEETTKEIVVKRGLVGIDYFNDSKSIVTLYDFINDSNLINENTYAEFQPIDWEMINNFGL